MADETDPVKHDGGVLGLDQAVVGALARAASGLFDMQLFKQLGDQTVDELTAAAGDRASCVCRSDRRGADLLHMAGQSAVEPVAAQVGPLAVRDRGEVLEREPPTNSAR